MILNTLLIGFSVLRWLIWIIAIAFILYFIFGIFFRGSGASVNLSSSSSGSENNEITTKRNDELLAEIDDFSSLLRSNKQNDKQSQRVENFTQTRDNSGNVYVDQNNKVREGTAGILGFQPVRGARGNGFNEDCSGGIIFDPCLVVGDPTPASGQMYFGSDRS